MNPATNTVEVRLPRAGVVGMVWAIALFTLIGLIASMIMLGSLHGLPPEGLVLSFIACLMLLSSVAGLLTWQLARLITVYRDAVKQTINKTQFEVLPPSPQPQQFYIPAGQPQAPSVVEQTTRQMAGVYADPRE